MKCRVTSLRAGWAIAIESNLHKASIDDDTLQDVFMFWLMLRIKLNKFLLPKYQTFDKLDCPRLQTPSNFL